MRLSPLLIFILSIFASLTILLFEFSYGIGWDYHPDAVTYITKSDLFLNEIISSGNFSGLLNNGFYIVVSMLDQNIYLVIIYNILLFSFSNVLILKIHYQFNPCNKNIIIFLALLFFIFNPYRLHLSVSVLKETSVIFFLILLVAKPRYQFLSIISLLFLRIVSVLYIFPVLYKNTKQVKYLVAIFIFLALSFDFVDVYKILISLSQSNLSFREFDTTPIFQEYGKLGIVMRAIIWPILAISGFFMLLSAPSLPFIVVGFSCFFILIYTRLVTKRFTILPVFFALAIFAIIVPGFTSYIRYVYPLIILTPLVIMRFSSTSSLAPKITSLKLDKL